MLSTRGNRTAVLLAAVAVFFALVGNATIWINGERERGKIEKLAKQNADLAAKTNEGLVCLLQRAIATVRANPGNRTPEEVEFAVSYYQREISLLGGNRDCDGDARRIRP